MTQSNDNPAAAAAAAGQVNGDPAGDADGAVNGSGDNLTDAQRIEQLEAALSEWKGHARKWEDRAKAAEPAAAELAALRDKDKTVEQKLAEISARADAAERALSVYRIAAETGVDPKFITGSTEDEMKASAADFKAALDAAVAAATAPKSPAPDPSQGGTGGGNRPSESDIGREEAARRFAKKS